MADGHGDEATGDHCGVDVPGNRRVAGATGRRRAVETALDALARRHRVTVAVTVPAVGAALLLAASRDVVPVDLVRHPVPLLVAVLVMRLPLVAGLLPTFDRRASAGLAALAALAYAVESIGVATGVPYGAFAYTADLGPMLGGTVPLALPLLYVPLVLDSYLLGLLLIGRWAPGRPARVLVGVGALLLVDLVLDPGAVAVGFWAYAAGGPWYGVPLSNFVGWIATGTLAVVLVDVAFDPTRLRERARRTPYALDDLAGVLVLWGGVDLVLGQWAPVVVALALALGVAVATVGPGRPTGSSRPVVQWGAGAWPFVSSIADASSRWSSAARASVVTARRHLVALKYPCVVHTRMPKLACPDCGRDVAMHELDTRTLARSSGFQTNYRCPFCRSDFEDVAELF